ncbi:MAG: heavy-metal-associated domain-containing protein [Firmicutes bacterium]|nr:heavy-metal-associated domain-containing protein [Bacillota bacterium]
MSANINSSELYTDVAITIEGMKCFYCFTVIADILKDFKGIKEVRVGLSKGQAIVTYDHKKINSDSLVNELRKAGYTVKL